MCTVHSTHKCNSTTDLDINISIDKETFVVWIICFVCNSDEKKRVTRIAHSEWENEIKIIKVHK